MFNENVLESLETWLIHGNPKDRTDLEDIIEESTVVKDIRKDVNRYLDTYGMPILQRDSIRRNTVRRRYQYDVENHIFELKFNRKFFIKHRKKLSEKELSELMLGILKGYISIQATYKALYGEDVEFEEIRRWVDGVRF